MKTRFTTVDIKASVFELRERLLGLRVVNVYDVDNKTYLIKLAKPDKKEVLLLESGTRFHATDFEWPKNTMPSGFAMKMRKHLKSRRLEKLEQVGEDRIIDIQFGSGEAAYHVILELYDRGNLVLTDHEYLILNILRPRTDESQDVRFAVREKYPLECAKKAEDSVDTERLSSVLSSAKQGDTLKKVLLPHFAYGPAVLEHCLVTSGFSSNAKIGKDVQTDDVSRIVAAFQAADSLVGELSSTVCKGYITQKVEKATAVEPQSETTEINTYVEFHPYLFSQISSSWSYVEFESFNKAVDEFFSKIESQKLDVKMLQQEKAALKKLDNVKKDHVKRLEELESEQMSDIHKAQLIEINLTLVDRAISVIRSLLASQLDWLEIEKLVAEASAQGDPVAGNIKSLKLQSNHITMLLKPGASASFDSDGSSEDEGIDELKPMKIDIDLGLSAYANARKYFDLKRHASQKHQKTIDASQKALKSAERKTKQTLKEVKTVATINKARKTYWFEKFLWCISSENYLLIGGRDQQQNEMIVKRYFRPGDLYVHADIHGASSIIIKNPTREPVPPKTLNEAGTMALCYSAAWDARIVTSAWWVHHDQVSKTAPTGEYLTTGSFMIRGKKNFLSPSHLIYGFGFLFKVDESCIARHKNERRVRTLEEDDDAMSSQAAEPSSVGDADIDVTSESDSDSDSEKNGEDDDAGDLQSTEFPRSEKTNDGSDDDDDDDDELKSDDQSRADDKLSENFNAVVTTEDSRNETSAVKTDPERAGFKQETAPNVSEDNEFPDTSLQLRYVGGDKFTLQSAVKSSVVAVKTEVDDDDDDQRIYLGDNKPVVLGGNANSGGKQAGSRLSAKQRREMKKSQQVRFDDKSSATASTVDDEIASQQRDPAVAAGVPSSSLPSRKPAAQQQQQPQQLKRGQKSKMKKIQEKYGDQDEEERQLRLEILASSGSQKVDTKSKKGRKGKDAKPSAGKQQGKGKATQPQRPGSAVSQDKSKSRPTTVEDITVETAVIGDSGAAVAVSEKPVAQSEDAVDVDDDDETTAANQDADILDSLTGIPQADDLLLFCIPVCAPYSALNNYRYKVKLMPGTTKRGKAVKMSLEMFQRDKTATPREKDLFRSVKDADLSRNMPGKVKVSAPNLHRQKNR